MKRNEVLIDDFVIQNLYHGITPSPSKEELKEVPDKTSDFPTPFIQRGRVSRWSGVTPIPT
jgi:hypothetical protein